MSKYPQFPVIDKSFDYIFNTCFISLDPKTYYIASTPCTVLQSKISQVTISVSLHTQTGLCHLIIQGLNIRVYFIDIWYTSLTSVHYNLEHGLVIVTESFNLLNLDYTTSFVKVQIRSGLAKPYYF